MPCAAGSASNIKLDGYSRGFRCIQIFLVIKGNTPGSPYFTPYRYRIFNDYQHGICGFDDRFGDH